MPWIILFFAGLFEVAWAVGMKYTQNWTKPVPIVFTIGCMIVSFYLLSVAIKHIPVGTAYAVWTGIGTVGTVIYAILFFKESSDIYRIICILLIIAGIIGLKIITK